ncbi:hypothetical protein K8U61_21965 [Nocardioides sp. GBK3QG-3]|uniref:Uncharacterized protein n=1 Tax=Nocardioides mangrovi TaxID=2874580 RepID=A0ABS7UJA4_9ACTN|nr:hypothetical protein [Nocardioides mangrovi]
MTWPRPETSTPRYAGVTVKPSSESARSTSGRSASVTVAAGTGSHVVGSSTEEA